MLRKTLVLCFFLASCSPEYELKEYEGAGLDQVDEPEIPQVFIETDAELSKYKRPGWLRIVSSNPNYSSGPHAMGISIRGNSSTRYEKKSFDLQIGHKSDWQKKFNIRLLGMRDDDDWKLGADYADPLAMRNYITHKLYQKMRQGQKFPKRTTVDITHVEVFLNGEYFGLYTFLEQEDRKQFGLPHSKRFESKYNELIDSIFQKFEVQKKRWAKNLYRELGNGLYKVRNLLFPVNEVEYQALYKARLLGADFTQLDGMVQKYPKIENAEYFAPLEKLIEFVDKSEKSTFDEKVWERVDFDSFVDYFILLAISGSVDNVQSNYLLAMDPGLVFHFIPWDLDNTWMLRHYKKGYVISKYDSFPFASNRLFERALENPRFVSELKKRWRSYREGLLSYESLSQMFLETYEKLEKSGAYRRNFERWDLIEEGQTVRQATAIDEVLAWIEKRQAFLDRKIESL